MNKKIYIRYEETASFDVVKKFPKIRKLVGSRSRWHECISMSIHEEHCEWDEFLTFLDTHVNINWNQICVGSWYKCTMLTRIMSVFRNAPKYIDKRCKQLVDRMTDDALNSLHNNSKSLLEFACHAHCANTVDALIARAPAINLDMSIPTNLEFECKDGKGMCMTLYERVKKARALLVQNTLTFVSNLFLFPVVLNPVIVEYLF